MPWPMAMPGLPANWSIPFQLGGRAIELRGEVDAVPPARFWPWLLPLAALSVVVLAARRWRPEARPLLLNLTALLAGLAAVLTVVGFTSTDATNVSQQRLTFGALCVLALLGILAYGLLERTRTSVRAATAVLALLVGLDSLPALWRPVILSSWHPDVARALISVTLAATLAFFVVSLHRPATQVVGGSRRSSEKRPRPREARRQRHGGRT